MAWLYFNPHLDPEAPFAHIEGTEARHASVVSRLRLGETLAIADGRGNRVRGAIIESRPDLVRIEVQGRSTTPIRTPQLWLIQAIAKGDRDERAIESASELGVDVIIPWAADRSVSQWGGKTEKALARWRTITFEASKQSLRDRLPEVREPVSLEHLVNVASSTNLLVADPLASTRLSQVDLDSRPVAVVVGPEGGLSNREREGLQAAGAQAFVLGPEILRTSTAGPAALSVLNSRLGRW